MTATAHHATWIEDSSQYMSGQARLQLWVALLEQSAEGILVCGPDQRILVVNAAFERITGYSAQEAMGHSPRLLHSGRQGREFYTDMWRSIDEHGRWSGEIWNRRKTGESYVQWLTVQAVRNRRGKVIHYLGIFSDLTDSKAAQAQMRRLSEHDPLTLLPNRALLLQRLRQLAHIARDSGVPLAVLCIDLDRFRDLNDSMGSDTGDLILQIVARRIRSVVRHSDMVARTSANEFVVLLPALPDAASATVTAQKVLDAIGEPMALGEQEVIVSASAGLCICDGDSVDAEAVLRNAIAAVQSAKHDSRGRCVPYTRDMNDKAPGRLRLENALRLAVERQEFVLHYQPQVDLASGAIVGAEALVRWNRPGAGLVMPGEFIPLAEETGLIRELGRWTTAQALRQMRTWEIAGLPGIGIAVNVSAVELRQPSFVDDLAREIARQRVDPSRLELELTESIAVHDVDAVIRILERLRAVGVRLSLDDFGIGYSSLSYLSRFPLDRIKIDRSFVRDMAGKAQAMQIVRAIIALARNFGMKVIAEGVETVDQLRALRVEGCQEIQGYLASRPLPAREFSRWVQAWKPAGLR